MRLLWLALRFLVRDRRAGELHVIGIAVLIAVASVSSIEIITQRLDNSFILQANALLGADLVISSKQKMSDSHNRRAQRFDLKMAQTIDFYSMVLYDKENLLAEIRAVSQAYPLRGVIEISGQKIPPDGSVHTAPGPGHVWMDGLLMSRLNISVGDHVTVGQSRLHVAARISNDPARVSSLFNIAPRLLMNMHDLEQTGLIQDSSRLVHRLLFSGTQENIAIFKAETASNLRLNERILGLDNAQPEIKNALNKATSLLELVLLCTLLLAGMAVATAARRYGVRHTKNNALLRCLGMKMSEVRILSLIQISVLGFLASLAGCLLGYLLHFILMTYFQGMFNHQLPPAGLAPLLTGLLTGLITTIGFAIPVIFSIANVPVVRALQTQGRDLVAGQGLYYLPGIILLLLFFALRISDLKLYLIVVGSVVALIGMLFIISIIAVKLCKGLIAHVSPMVRVGLLSVIRHASESTIQVVAVGTGVMLLLLTLIIRDDVLSNWQASLPVDAPNRFLINIQPQQLDEVRNYFTAHGQGETHFYPMVRGRLSAINGQQINAESYATVRARKTLSRDFNLSSASHLPVDNSITAGQWWGAENEQNLLSIEQGIAKTLGIELGDELQFSIAGNVLSAKVGSIRKVEWGTFNVNFFIITTAGLLEQYPKSYITSFYLAAAQEDFLNGLIQQYPNITVIDVSALMQQVRYVMDQVASVMQYVIVFTLLMGLVVVVASVLVTMDERIKEAAVMRVLGASRRQIYQRLLVEFSVLGVISGLIAAFAASLCAYLLSERIFHVAYWVDPWVFFNGILVSVSLLLVVAVASMRFVTRDPPFQVLYRAMEV